MELLLECINCHNRFRVSGSGYWRCPHCGERFWADAALRIYWKRYNTKERKERKQESKRADKEKHIGKTCPYCQYVIKPGVDIVVCSECGIPHHKECWQENGNKCTTFGCRGTTLRETEEETSVSSATEMESHLEYCRICGRAILPGERTTRKNGNLYHRSCSTVKSNNIVINILVGSSIGGIIGSLCYGWGGAVIGALWLGVAAIDGEIKKIKRERERRRRGSE